MSKRRRVTSNSIYLHIFGIYPNMKYPMYFYSRTHDLLNCCVIIAIQNHLPSLFQGHSSFLSSFHFLALSPSHHLFTPIPSCFSLFSQPYSPWLFCTVDTAPSLRTAEAIDTNKKVYSPRGLIRESWVGQWVSSPTLSVSAAAINGSTLITSCHGHLCENTSQQDEAIRHHPG